MKAIDRKLTEIANRDIFYCDRQRENLNRKYNGEWDFFEVAIWDLKKALTDAYELGRRDAEKNS